MNPSCPKCKYDTSILLEYDEDFDEELDQSILIEYYECPNCKHTWDVETIE